MGSDCASATACCASTSSPSSTIPRSPPTTTLPSAISAIPLPTGRSPVASAPPGAPISSPPSDPSSAPPPDAASTPSRPSAPPYRATPSSPRVEQVQAVYDLARGGLPMLPQVVVDGAEMPHHLLLLRSRQDHASIASHGEAEEVEALVDVDDAGLRLAQL